MVGRVEQRLYVRSLRSVLLDLRQLGPVLQAVHLALEHLGQGVEAGDLRVIRDIRVRQRHDVTAILGAQSVLQLFGTLIGFSRCAHLQRSHRLHCGSPCFLHQLLRRLLRRLVRQRVRGFEISLLLLRHPLPGLRGQLAARRLCNHHRPIHAPGLRRLRADAGTQGHACARCAAHQGRVQHLIRVHLPVVRERLQERLQRLLACLTEPVDERSRDGLRTGRDVECRLIHVIRRDRRVDVTALTEQRHPTRTQVVHHLTRSHHRQRGMVAGNVARSILGELHAREIDRVVGLPAQPAPQTTRLRSTLGAGTPERAGPSHDAAPDTELHHIHRQRPDTRRSRTQVHITVTVEEDAVVLSTRLIEGLATRENQLASLAADLPEHLRRECSCASRSAHLTDRTHRSGSDIRSRPQRVALDLAAVIHLVERALVVAALAPADDRIIRETMHHVAQRVQGLRREPRPSRCPREEARTRALPIRQPGLHLAPSRLLLQFIPVQVRTDAADRCADTCADRSTHRGEEHADTCADRSTTQRTSHWGRHIHGVAPLILLLRHLRVERVPVRHRLPVRNILSLSRAHQVVQLILGRHPLQIIRVHPEPTEDLIRVIHAVLLVHVADLAAIVEHIPGLDHLILALIVLTGLIGPGDTSLTVEEVVIGGTVLNRCLIVPDERLVERRVPTVLSAASVPAGEVVPEGGNFARTLRTTVPGR